MLGGENGIVTQATQAQNENIIGQEKEEIKLAYSAAKSKKLKLVMMK